MKRVAGVLGALVFAGAVAACSLIPAASLTDAEWSWCQEHWRDGLEPSQQAQPAAGDWYFNHMGMRDDPDTIRVCRAAAARR